MSDVFALPPLQPEAPVLVGFSGGLDSSALLHALASTPAVRARGLRALHIDHGLHPESSIWAANCADFCAARSVALQVVRVAVRNRGEGLEAAARQARYGAFAAALAPGEWLALAQHRDDQAETVLLRLLRASGSDGLAAMRAFRPFAAGALWRPLLAIDRAHLLGYARAQALSWLEDPSNGETRFDRNYLRQQVLPSLRVRWPHAAAALARSAHLLAEESDLLAEESTRRLASIRGPEPATLSVTALREQSPPWRARLLRDWVAGLGLPPLPAAGIRCVQSDLLDSRPDANARFVWRDASVRRWRGLLYAGRKELPLPTGWQGEWDGRNSRDLPTGDRLELGSKTPGLAFDAPLHLRARRGGERITLPGRSHSHALKNALQELGLPPWRRERLPLLFADDGELLAVADCLISARMQTWLRDRDACLHLCAALPQAGEHN